ncbi:MAG: hypothetical protein JWN84_3006 [Nocardioides sp.]|jgi:hypothetical protein|nr:hypothetical protein [Nocardioides sp.]
MTDAPHHDQLPLPDYDHLPVTALSQRIRSLDATGVRTLLAYEQAHGDRLPIVQVLEHRISELDAGAPTSGGDPMAFAPEAHAGAPSGSKDSATLKEGPAMNPPSHGDPTNPAQPR